MKKIMDSFEFLYEYDDSIFLEKQELLKENINKTKKKQIPNQTNVLDHFDVDFDITKQNNNY